MAHPAVVNLKDELKQMDADAVSLSIAVSAGDMSEETKTKLRNILRRAKVLQRQVRELVEKKWAGVEEWMVEALETIITVCLITLSEFKRVPTAFEQAFA